MIALFPSSFLFCPPVQIQRGWQEIPQDCPSQSDRQQRRTSERRMCVGCRHWQEEWRRPCWRPARWAFMKIQKKSGWWFQSDASVTEGLLFSPHPPLDTWIPLDGWGRPDVWTRWALFFWKPRLLPPTLLAVWNPQAHTVGASARHTRLARLFGSIRKEGCGHEASQTVQGRIQVGSNQEGPDGGHLRFDRVVNSDFLNPTWWEQTEWWGSSRPSALNLSFEIRFLTWFDGEWRGAVEYSSKEKRRGGEWKLFFFKKKKYWPIKTHSTATMPAEPFCWMDPYRKWAFLTVWETREIHLTIDREWKRRGFSLLLLV